MLFLFKTFFFWFMREGFAISLSIIEPHWKKLPMGRRGNFCRHTGPGTMAIGFQQWWRAVLTKPAREMNNAREEEATRTRLCVLRNLQPCLHLPPETGEMPTPSCCQGAILCPVHRWPALPRRYCRARKQQSPFLAFFNTPRLHRGANAAKWPAFREGLSSQEWKVYNMPARVQWDVCLCSFLNGKWKESERTR